MLAKKQGCTGRRLWGIIVRKLCQWEEVRPIVLLVIDVHPDVLLKDLIGALHLAIGLRMVCGAEVGLNSKECAEGGPEA